MKAIVKCGSLVTVYKHRTFVVSGETEEEIREKADERFRKVCSQAPRYIDVGGSVEIESVEIIG